MKEKNLLGQFYTPRPIAEFMINWVLGEKGNDILDPAAGLGVFLLAGKKRRPNLRITAFEIDKQTCKNLSENCHFDFNLKNQDYLDSVLDEKFGAIICNPPYNKFQQIPKRKYYNKLFKENYGISLSGYSNLCVYFLIKSVNELKANGRCCYILPYEFLNTGYGETVKKYLLDLKIIKHIIKFDSRIKLFKDAITTSCILCLEKNDNGYIDFINVYDLDEMKDFPKNSKRLAIGEIDFKEKWLNYFNSEKRAYVCNNLVCLSSIVKVKRGIATGNNDFFVLSEEKIKAHNLSRSACVPCVTKSQNLDCCILTEEVFRRLAEKNKKMFLFDGTKALSKGDFDYIAYGESRGCDKAYLTSHRKPWYSLEKKDSAPILISVFNRGKLKIIRNEAKAKNLTAFHGLYFNGNVSEDYINIFYCYLITPAAREILKRHKREYGEGLDKFEPNDLNNAMVLDMKAVSQSDKEKILKIYGLLKADNNQSHIIELNEIFEKYIKT